MLPHGLPCLLPLTASSHTTEARSSHERGPCSQAFVEENVGQLENSSVNTSFVSVVQTKHLKVRQDERGIVTRDLQSAKKHGVKVRQPNGTIKHEHGDLKYITSSDMRVGVTAMRRDDGGVTAAISSRAPPPPSAAAQISSYPAPHASSAGRASSAPLGLRREVEPQPMRSQIASTATSMLKEVLGVPPAAVLGLRADTPAPTGEVSGGPSREVIEALEALERANDAGSLREALLGAMPLLGSSEAIAQALPKARTRLQLMKPGRGGRGGGGGGRGGRGGRGGVNISDILAATPSAPYTPPAPYIASATSPRAAPHDLAASSIPSTVATPSTPAAHAALPVESKAAFCAATTSTDSGVDAAGVGGTIERAQSEWMAAEGDAGTPAAKASPPVLSEKSEAPHVSPQKAAAAEAVVVKPQKAAAAEAVVVKAAAVQVRATRETSTHLMAAHRRVLTRWLLTG